MQNLNLPEYKLKIKKENDKTYIFDLIRKKYLVLTPEEWVRQNFINYLIEEKNYPSSLIAIEKKVDVNGMTKRFDALIFNSSSKPKVIIEFKAPKIKITQEVFEQASRYNYSIKADYLIVSNGINHYCAKINFTSLQFEFLKDIPKYNELI